MSNVPKKPEKSKPAVNWSRELLLWACVVLTGALLYVGINTAAVVPIVLALIAAGAR